MSVGLGCFFVLGVRALQQNLIAESVIGVRQGSADMFLIDIQPDQADGVRAMLDARQEGADAGAARANAAGACHRRARPRRQSRELRRRARARRRSPASTRSPTATDLEPNEDVTSGQFWTGEPPLRADAEQEVSIEQSIHERFGINVGDLMRFDVLGPDVRGHGHERSPRALGRLRAAAASCSCSAPARWRARRTRSSASSAGQRPQTPARACSSTSSRSYPNVSAIDARDVIARIQAVVDNVMLAISIVGGIALASGVLILVGAVAMTKFQRVYEAAILRTLGASTRLLDDDGRARVLGARPSRRVIGAAGALALSWAVTRSCFEIAWRPAAAACSSPARC